MNASNNTNEKDKAVGRIRKRSKKQITKRQRRFLRAYVVCYRISHAARQGKVARSRHYEWLKNPAYAAAFEQARKDADARIEAQTAKLIEEMQQRWLARLALK